ncbi:MAG: tRNA uridine(34) 5-carboxymethylaminomethyl modification radical SAM/GNAT enzyme Elp3 [Candidatus Nealsonbacteria bacterium]
MKKELNSFELAIKIIIKSKVKTLADLDSVKRKIAKKLKISSPSNTQLLEAYHNLVKNKIIKIDKNLEFILRKRKIRSLSGIVIVSVLTKAYPCPGNCLYCPTQKGIPKSYLEKEPAVMRAILNKFDPYLQFQNRIQALEVNGHPTDKVDLRIIGATWSYYPKKYQTWFIRRCFEAANFKKSKTKKQKSKLDIKNKNLKEVQKENEKAKHRIIGITIETRPDYIDAKEIKRLRELGVTRVELGVQSIYDKILKINNRGHLIDKTILTTKLLKDAGFKVCYQMMPNLPGSDLKHDQEMFKQLFQNQDFQPDLLKIYPCSVLKEAELYKLWKKGKYKSYTENELKKLIKSIKKDIPYYVRIQRIIRDIPSFYIAGNTNELSNLRQVILQEIKKENWRCKCIRCREVGMDYNPKEKLYLYRKDYNASNGKEIFLSYENKDQTKIYSLLRLRIPSIENRSLYSRPKTSIESESLYSDFPVLKDSAIIREIHTYGQMIPIGKKSSSAQHKGLGKKLMKQAERIAKKEFGLSKIAVISGIGVKPYYKKLGYTEKDTYMTKNI